jgi:hypothetical protein
MVRAPAKRVAKLSPDRERIVHRSERPVRAAVDAAVGARPCLATTAARGRDEPTDGEPEELATIEDGAARIRGQRGSLHQGLGKKCYRLVSAKMNIAGQRKPDYRNSIAILPSPNRLNEMPDK